MARATEFVQFDLELLAPVGEVRARAMFGGFGNYRKDTMFTIAVDDRLHFNTDDASRRKFSGLDLGARTYDARAGWG